MLFATRSPDPTPVDPSTSTLNALVRRVPEALPILHRHGMDTCCGGDLTVTEACRRHGVDVEALLAEVARCVANGTEEAV